MRLLRKSCYSSVYVWKDTKVIKRVDKRYKKECMNEINILRRLENSPYVVDMDFVYEDNKNVYMVLEYCKHGCMYDNNTILKEDRLRQVITSLLMCILECHKHMIIHGDIKLTNFVVDEKNTTKLIDFGCSAIVKTPYDAVECKEATWYFAAPENMRSVKYLYSDMWCLGICAYALATGKHPFQHNTSINIWNIKMDIENKYWKQLSSDCQDFITRLLQFEPYDRMSSYDALCHPWIVS